MSDDGLPPGYPQIHAVGAAFVWLIFTALTILVVDVAQAMAQDTKAVVVQKIEDHKQRYNNLPEIGKINEDIKVKKVFAVGGFVAPVAVWAFFGVLMTPMIALLPASVAARWAWRNMKEQSSEILDDQAKREKLCS